jgi:acyl dehydratase
VSAAVAGGEIPSLDVPPVTPEVLREFALASGDDNPVHLDADAAARAGLDGVVAHGMLVMAQLGRLVTGWPAAGALRSFKARFTAPTPVGATVTCSGRVVSVDRVDGTWRAKVRLSATSGGTTVARGESVVDLVEVP